MVSEGEWESEGFAPKEGSGLLGQRVFPEPAVGPEGKGLSDPFVCDGVTQSLMEWA
jgi:hypothetical protein